ncbi:acetyltransferase, GNAT family [Jimgerdemannia flammicorona]|uniref:Acetyltransferase, GNAT family n=1 Tax=Jimgerdemannia flammicorona TaxID=994334 RepID=A0A433DA87_9FUNG|nr:acetyltransferase, GNAT family [Jimgerdemannia flammicorona]
MSNHYRIVRIDSITPEIFAAFSRLLPQLSSSAPPLTYDYLSRVISSPHNYVFVAEASADSDILGTLTLTTAPTITGVRAHIEDVVVDSAARGRGVGSALIMEAVRIANSHELRAMSVDLTSRPERVEANQLYQKLGFQKRGTNVYRYVGLDS